MRKGGLADVGTDMKWAPPIRFRSRSLSSRLKLQLELIQTLLAERINQFSMLSYVTDISPHMMMASLGQEKEHGEQESGTHTGGGGAEAEPLPGAG